MLHSPVPRNPRGMRKHSLGHAPNVGLSKSSTLPRPPRAGSRLSNSSYVQQPACSTPNGHLTDGNNNSKPNTASLNFSNTKRFFDSLEAKSRNNNSGGPSYSTMSLPRKMPVKKLVSVFNNQIEREGHVTRPAYSTLQRRLRQNRTLENTSNEAEPLRRKSFMTPAESGSEAARRKASLSMEVLSVTEDGGDGGERMRRRESVERIIEDWKRQIGPVREVA